MKRKLTITTLAAAALLSGVAVAGTSVLRSPAAARNEAPAREPAKVINDVKALGTYMFAATNVDYQHERAFVNFQSNVPHKLNKMGYLWSLENTTDNLLYIIQAGCNTPEGYFAMLARAYSIGTWVDSWIKVNPNDGSYEFVARHKDNAAFQWEGSHDYAYNYHDGKMYGVAADMTTQGEGGAVTSMIGEIDTATGAFTKLATTPEYVFCIAFDYDGNAYGITWGYDAEVSEYPTSTYLVKFDSNWKFAEKKLLQVDGANFAPYYIHTMEFDHTTGELWWAGTNLDARQYLFNIDVENGTMTRKGSIGWNDIINGLYIPFETADHREAPARVSGLDFAPSADGSTKVTLSWTNPSTQWNRKPLAQLNDIEIYRDNTMSPIAVAQGAPGEACTFTDEASPAGLHTYYVIPTNDKGLGVMDSIRAFSGRDVPGPVQSVKSVALNGGKNVTVSWKAPVTGANDGWFDSSNLTYNVTRMPDNVRVAEGLTKTSYKDQDIEVVERYTYVVTAVTPDGEGTPADSPEVLAGTYVPVPYSTDFENKTDANRWTPRDLNADNKTFEYNDFDWPDCGRCWRHLLSESGNDDDLVSPPFNFEAGKTYKAIFRCHFHDLGQSYTFNFKYGLDPTSLNVFDTQDYVGSDTRYDSMDELVTYFTATSSEPGYVAINATTGKTCDVFRVYGFSIEEEFAKDMAVIGFESPREIVNGQPASFAVNVHNNGSEFQDAYKLQVVADGKIVVGETSEVKALNSRRSAITKFTIVPDVNLTGHVALTARVVLDGDQNASNDDSEPVDVEILPEGNLPVNHTVQGALPGVSSTIPMAHYYPYSLVQTIYPTSELKLPVNEGPVFIHRLGWEYTVEPNEDGSPAEVLGTTLKVALGQTPASGFAQSGASWSPSRQQVYSGRVSFLEGTHYLIVNLDRPFEVDLGQSLVVTVAKDNFASQGDWRPFFTIYGEDWKNPSSWHSLKALGSKEQFGLTSSPNPTVVPEAAKLFLAWNHEASGVSSAVDFGQALTYDRLTRSVRILGLDARMMQIADVAGNVVYFRQLQGQDNVPVDLAPGLYIVRVKGADGRTLTAKCNVR